MGIWYGDKETAKVNICHALSGKGWKIYGYKEDGSDSMTDYYDPAHWEGIATKNGFTLVIDVYSNSNSEKEVTKFTKNIDYDKISKLEALANDRAATEGEKQNVLNMIDKIKNSHEESKRVLYKYPKFKASTEISKNTKWHIEKDGCLVAKGNGIYKYYQLPYDYNCFKMQYEPRKYWGSEELSKPDEEQQKLIDSFENFINKIEKIVNSSVKVGDGTKATEKEGLEAEQQEGYEKVIERKVKKVLKMVEIERDYFQKGDYITISWHGHYWLITDEYMRKGKWNGVEKMEKAFTYEIVGSASRGYKQLKNPKRYYDYDFRMVKNLEEGKIKVFELKEVEEAEEIEVYKKVNSNSQKTTASKKESPKGKKDKKDTFNSLNTNNNYEFTIKKTIHTKTNKDIWVCKLVKTVTKEEFKKVLSYIDSLDGYYSRFVHGFVFNFDPTELFNNINNNNITESKQEKKEEDEIKDNHIYNVHFKEWNFTVNELIKEVKNMNLDIEYTDMGNKIGFDYVTADQARQLKELSDKNQSVFFIDWEVSKEEFEIIKHKAEGLIDRSTEIITQLELNHENYYNSEDYKILLFEYVREFISKEELKEVINYINNNYRMLTYILDGFMKEINRIEDTDFKKIITKIDKNIESFNKKLDSISGNYKTNTYKRMREEESRESTREFYRQEIEILKCLRKKAINKTITEFEIQLLTNTFRDDIRSHSSRAKYNKMVKYPSVSECRVEWAKEETKKEIKRLQKAGINNYLDLEKAIKQFKNILDNIANPVNEIEKKIKQLTNKYKLEQKGDINFTPLHVVDQLIELAEIDNNSRVLEPSAGIGNIADKIKGVTNNIDCIEKMTSYQELLKLKGFNVVGSDFLTYNRINYYDAIIMNPPFSKNQDIQHIQHAYKMLRPGGKLVAISSKHWTFASDKQSQEFREWIEEKLLHQIELESGTFEMTNVSSNIIVLEKFDETKQEAI